MGLKKTEILKDVPITTDSGTLAAIERLQSKTIVTAGSQGKTINKYPEVSSGYKARDFDKEARGKTRCVQFEAALMSPAIAGMKFRTMEEYLGLVKQAADAGVAYTFGE